MLQTRVSNTLVISIKSLITLQFLVQLSELGVAIAPIAPLATRLVQDVK